MTFRLLSIVYTPCTDSGGSHELVPDLLWCFRWRFLNAWKLAVKDATEMKKKIEM